MTGGSGQSGERSNSSGQGDGQVSGEPFGDLLGTLAARVTDKYLAAILIVFIVLALVVLKSFAGNLAALALLVAVALVVLGLIAMVRRERARVRVGVRVTPEDTVALAASLDEGTRTQIRRVLAQAATEAAQTLSVDELLVRSNVFGVSHGKLRMINGLVTRMDRSEELDLELDIGQGSTGLAFVRERPNIAVLREDWGTAALPGEQMAKVHPDLRWIVSVPVFGGGPQARPVWILNVDGLGKTPPLTALQEVVVRMASFAQVLALMLSRATEDKEENS